MSIAHDGAAPADRIAGKPSVAPALSAGILCLICLCLTALATKLLAGVRFRDATLLREFSRLATPSTGPWENTIIGVVDTGPGLVLGVLIVSWAIARRRLRLAALVTLVPIASVISAETVKALLEVPRDSAVAGPHSPSPHSWPSGHTTAITSLALCAIIVAPQALRLFVATIGAAVVIAVSISLIAVEAHFPSDVLGGYFMAGTWTCLGLAALHAFQRISPGSR